MRDIIEPANRHSQLQAKECHLVDSLERKAAEHYGDDLHCVMISWKGEFLACKKKQA